MAAIVLGATPTETLCRACHSVFSKPGGNLAGGQPAVMQTCAPLHAGCLGSEVLVIAARSAPEYAHGVLRPGALQQRNGIAPPRIRLCTMPGVGARWSQHACAGRSQHRVVLTVP